MSEPIATWNSARGVWETPTQNLLCGHLEPFSQTWPKSGSMRNGSVFLRRQPAPVISAGASLSLPGLLPTPRVSGGSDIMSPAPSTLTGKHGSDLGPAIGALLPTPRASERENRQTKRTPSQEAGTHGLCLAAEVLELLPAASREGGPSLTDCLLPTPRATDGTKWGPGQTSTGGPSLPSSVMDLLPDTAFGRYEAAVRRHERAFGRLVPSPVEPGRNGDPRLSPAFVEWMQGLPRGLVTDVPGLSRNAQLKALGNGVVPAQAAMALRILLGAIEAGAAA